MPFSEGKPVVWDSGSKRTLYNCSFVRLWLEQLYALVSGTFCQPRLLLEYRCQQGSIQLEHVEISFCPEPIPLKLILLRYCKYEIFYCISSFDERFTEVLYMNNFCFDSFLFWTPYFTTLLRIFMRTSRTTSLAKHQRYGDKPASIGRLSDGSATSTGQAWENEFLVSRSEDKFNSLYQYLRAKACNRSCLIISCSESF